MIPTHHKYHMTQLGLVTNIINRHKMYEGNSDEIHKLHETEMCKR